MITVHSPATVSNVVCGFDCLGFALESPFDVMTLRTIERPEVRIIHTDEFGLSTDPSVNVAGVALEAFRRSAGIRTGFEVTIQKQIKPGSGIGSSAASAAGAVVAADRLAGTGFSPAEIIEIAMEGEVAASGSRHADNIGPCVMGGFTLVRSSDPVDVVALDFEPLYAAVIHPQIEVRTSAARAMLPADVPLADAVKNWSNLGAFVAAVARGDHGLMTRSMVDTIVEPVRRSLIPHFDDVKAAGLGAGAIGGGISGSGPSCFMLCADRRTAEQVTAAMSSVFDGTNIEFNVHVSCIDPRGVRIVEN